MGQSLKQHHQWQQPGFTLIEFMLYIGIAGFVLFAVAQAMLLIGETRRKNQTMAEIEYQGLILNSLLTTQLRNATTIVTPLAGTTSATISLITQDSTKNPTVFSATPSSFFMQEGVTPPATLLPSYIQISDVMATNLSANDAFPSISFRFTLSHTTNGRSEYTYSKTFYGSATPRK